MNVFSCRSLHLVLSLFFLPMVVVYAVTGLLYLAGTDENFTSTVTVHELDGTDRPPYQASLRELERRGATLPEGKVRPFKGNYVLGPLTSDHVLFIRKGDALRAEVVSPGMYPKLLLVHKGKAGWWFAFLGWGAAFSLLAAYVTGIALMWKSPGRRRLMLFTAALGGCAGGAGFFLLCSGAWGPPVGRAICLHGCFAGSFSSQARRDARACILTGDGYSSRTDTTIPRRNFNNPI